MDERKREAMNGYCPNCDKETQIEKIHQTEEFNVRGENIEVEVEFFRCQECREEFENSKTASDTYETAYREYRERRGMLQPEEMREFRIQRGLTQKEFSKLLGIGIATLNRYENGALQSEAHDRAMKMSMEPTNFMRLLSESQGVISESKKEKVLGLLEEETEASWLEKTRVAFGNYEADIYSGFKRLDLEKFFEAIKYFCYPEKIFKTKLMKLLFYADFGHFKKYAVSITGARYARLPYGPVPDQFATWLAILLQDDEGIEMDEELNAEYSGEVYVSKRVPDFFDFSPSEQNALSAVKNYFQDFSAKKISEFSHGERGYRETATARLISYHYAANLKYDIYSKEATG